MFWDTAYSATIDALLKKEDLTLIELLDDDDILQECKTQNKKLIQFLYRPEIITELIKLIIVEPSNDLPEAVRFKHSNMACEILTSELSNLDERIVQDQDNLALLFDFLRQEPPLNPILASYYSKVLSKLLTKNPEQNWFHYQCVCLQTIEFMRGKTDFIDSLFKHIDSPVMMDLLYNILTRVESDESQTNLFDWLKEQNLMKKLIQLLGSSDTDKHLNIAQFMSDIVRQSRDVERLMAYQEKSLTGQTDPILQLLDIEEIISLLLNIVLSDDNQTTESGIVSGIKIILTFLEKPMSSSEILNDKQRQQILDSLNEQHEEDLKIILTKLAPRLSDFHSLLINPPIKPAIQSTVGKLDPPFGNSRLHICILFTVLLETEKIDIINAICETEFFETLLKFFKQYCWNNFLHSQTKKCLTYAFHALDQAENEARLSPSALQKHLIVKCKIVSHLIDCWMHNSQMQSLSNGRRLGYMGHLIDIFDSLVSSINASDEFRALVEENLSTNVPEEGDGDNEKIISCENSDGIIDRLNSEMDNWKLITEPETGYLAKELAVQKKPLANRTINQNSFEHDLSQSKEFLGGDEYVNFLNDNEIGDLQNTLEAFEEACFDTISSFGFNNDNVWDDSGDNEKKSDETGNNYGFGLEMQFKRMWAPWNNSDDDTEYLSKLDDEDNKIILDVINKGIAPGDRMNNDLNDETKVNEFSPWSNDTEKNTINDDEPEPESNEGWADFGANNFADFDSDFSTSFNFNPSQNSQTGSGGTFGAWKEIVAMEMNKAENNSNETTDNSVAENKCDDNANVRTIDIQKEAEIKKMIIEKDIDGDDDETVTPTRDEIVNNKTVPLSNETNELNGKVNEPIDSNIVDKLSASDRIDTTNDCVNGSVEGPQPQSPQTTT